MWVKISYIEDGLASDVVSLEIKVFVEDDGIPSGGSQRDPQYVDFTDRVEKDGRNLLKEIGIVSQASETKVGQGSFQSVIRSISFSNFDGFFSRPIPKEIGMVFGDVRGDSYKSNLTTIKGNDAYFTWSRGYTGTVYAGHKIKIDIRVQLKDGSVSQGELGVFLIEGVNRTTDVATFTLTSLAQPLLERDASLLKDGLSWYDNKPISFLVDKILKEEYANSSGNLPNTFNITKNIRIQTADSLTGKNLDNRTLSAYGRPPERSAGTEANLRANSGSDSGSTWLEKGLITRSIQCWNFGTNSNFGNIVVASVTDNASTVHIEIGGTDLDIDGNWGSNALRPFAGDVMRIKNDTTTGNDGFYDITNVDESNDRTVLTLKTTLKGKINDSMEFNISRIYMGCDDELWMFRPDRDLYTSIDTSTLEVVSSNIAGLPQTDSYKMNIKRLWFDSKQKYIVGAAWHPEYDPDRDSDDEKAYATSTSMQVFKISLSGSNDVVTTIGSVISNVFTGEYCIRRGNGNFNLATSDGAWIGQSADTSNDGSENLALPFTQRVLGVPWTNTGNGNTGGYFDATETYEYSQPPTITTPTTDVGSTFEFIEGNTENTPKGYYLYSAIGYPATVTPNMARFSYGQTGFVVFNERSESKGAIFYCTFDYNAASSTFFDYHHFNVNLGTTNTIALGVGYKLNSLAVHPTCGCEILGKENIAVGLMSWRHNGGTGAADECRSYIQIIYELTGEVGNTIGRYSFLGSPTYASNEDDGGESYRTFTDMLPHWDVGGIEDISNLLVSGIYRDKLAKNDNYFLAHYDGDNPTVIDVRRTSATPMSKLAIDTEVAINPIFSSYFVDPELGFLYHYIWDNNVGVDTHTFTIVDNGHPYVVGDINMASNLSLDPYTMKDTHSLEKYRTIVYGCSAPSYPKNTQLNPPSGKHHLWKYDVYYTSRIELADFSNLSLWDVLKLFAEKINYLMGFEGENFFFVPKDISKTISHTFGNIEDNKGYTNISIDDGVKEIY